MAQLPQGQALVGFRKARRWQRSMFQHISENYTPENALKFTLFAHNEDCGNSAY